MNYYGVKYYCLTPQDSVNIILNQQNDLVILQILDQEFCLSDITGYWFRRGLFEVRIRKTSPHYNNKNEFAIPSYNHSTTEKNVIFEYFHQLLAEKKTVNNFLQAHVNKLIVLHKAKRVGLYVPRDLLTTSKKNLLEFYYLNNGRILTKVCAPAGGFENKNFSVGVLAEIVDLEWISQLKESFFPSFFQEAINKEFEIRSFFLNGKFFSMAIFSQESEKTKVDFRNYDEEFPNRCVPFVLPGEIEEKLFKLFKSLNLNSGSADLIYSTEDVYYFLEINPVGQFGMVSYPCNYYLEREIALYFKN